MNTPLFQRSPGFLFLTETPQWDNLLTNGISGDGPGVIRGTDPAGAPGGYVIQDAGWVQDATAAVAGWGETIARTTAGIALGLLLVAAGFYVFAKDV